jgi:hypothetical protein
LEQYPSIEGSAGAPYGKQCIAFYKYDGSNLRWEWSLKQGWHKFGTRKRLFDRTDEVYAPAIPIFLNTMGDEIVRRVKDQDPKCQRITAFTEYFGPGSFAGQHVPGDPMELRLFDVYLFKKGLIPPRQFLKMFGDLPWVAEVIYEGELTKEFAKAVREGQYPVWEGVIAKGDDFMCKIKTNAFFAKLNEVYGTDYRKYWE